MSYLSARFKCRHLPISQIDQTNILFFNRLTLKNALRNRFHFNSRFVWSSDEGSGRKVQQSARRQRRHYCEHRRVGLRKLAYPIDKKSPGYYALLEFEAPGAVVKKLEAAYRRDERAIRFLTFRLDKYAAEYAAKRRSLKGAKQQAEAAPAAQTDENKED